MTAKADFNQVFEELKSIFKPYSKKMDVVQDTDDYYLLNTRIIMRNKRPLAFGMVRLRVRIPKNVTFVPRRFNDCIWSYPTSGPCRHR